MTLRFSSCLLLCALALASCGGGRSPAVEEAARVALDEPRSVMADSAACAAVDPASTALVTYRQALGGCVRAFTGMDASIAAAAGKKHALAGASDVQISITDLFDWAERTYPQFFPSHQANRQLATYTYRYYPESSNHVAVSDGQVYVQGPVSGGGLLFVGSLVSFTCSVAPSTCGAPPKACAPVTNWVAGGNTCTPDAGQSVSTPSGSVVTFTDTAGTTRGAASYTCTDGVLSAKAPATCEVREPVACNTAGLTWSVAGNSCVANPDEPTQMASGTTHTFLDSVGTAGSVTYACSDGSLTATAGARCEPPTPIPCAPTVVSWQSGPNVCFAEPPLPIIADGASYNFIDVSGGETGNATFLCTKGVLQRTSAAVCEAVPHILDSFGNDGGAGDGGSSGDGSAGDGAPIVGGAVVVVDTKGQRATATTDSQGYYRVKLTGMAPPLVISVTRKDGVVRRSFSTQALKVNGYIFMAVTGLTDKMASDLARTAGLPGAASLTPAVVSAKVEQIPAVLAALRGDPVISAALGAAGVTPATFDPLYTPFRPNGTGYDKALDNLVITTDSSGATIVKSADCPAPTSWTVGSLTCVPDPGQATIIPSDGSIVLFDRVAPNTGSAAFSCSKAVVFGPFLPSCK